MYVLYFIKWPVGNVIWPQSPSITIENSSHWISSINSAFLHRFIIFVIVEDILKNRCSLISALNHSSIVFLSRYLIPFLKENKVRRIVKTFVRITALIGAIGADLKSGNFDSLFVLCQCLLLCNVLLCHTQTIK